jgi:hypothetical protein
MTRTTRKKTTLSFYVDGTKDGDFAVCAHILNDALVVDRHRSGRRRDYTLE